MADKRLKENLRKSASKSRQEGTTGLSYFYKQPPPPGKEIVLN